VRRGDALSTVATRWNTDPETLRAWNDLPSNKIRVGQKLIVKPGFEAASVAGEVGLPKK
jgi:LysM repeat protein